MPKKRFTAQYSKPQSTVHPSLQSNSSSSNHHDAPPTVNELISSSRKSNHSSQAALPTTTTTRTLPPQIRHLLAQPETPTPRPRTRRNFDADGRRLPPGPRAPQSWLNHSRRSTAEARDKTNEKFPEDVDHLPGSRHEGNGMTLQDMCLRSIAQNWEYMREYERNNMIYLPAGLRSRLLSNIAVYGPDEGVGYEGLRNLILPPALDHGQDEDLESFPFDPAVDNDGFFRLDLSGAMGKSVSFKQLSELVEKPDPAAATASANDDLSWEETLTISQSLSAPIPILTHLSLSHPSPSISWSRLISFSKLVPTLTHLSLAYWPTPTLMPNAKTAVMQSKFGGEHQYGDTNLYSHFIDNDFREAVDILRRLALRLYGLEYLDISGCQEWLRAFRWIGTKEGDQGLDWSSLWPKLGVLKVHSGIKLTSQSGYIDVAHFASAYNEALAVEYMIRTWIKGKGSRRRVTWIDVVKDDWMAYGEFWIGKGNSQDIQKKKHLLESLKPRRRDDGEGDWRDGLGEMTGLTIEEVERMSIWDQ